MTKNLFDFLLEKGEFDESDALKQREVASTLVSSLIKATIEGSGNGKGNILANLTSLLGGSKDLDLASIINGNGEAIPKQIKELLESKGLNLTDILEQFKSITDSFGQPFKDFTCENCEEGCEEGTCEKGNLPSFKDLFQGNSVKPYGATNVVEEDSKYIISVLLPETKKESITIKALEDTITIDVITEDVEPTGKYIGSPEFAFENVSRQITLSKANVDKLNATYRNGILIVTVPKIKEKPIETKTFDIK